MKFKRAKRVPLTAHPSTPGAAVRSLSVNVSSQEDGTLKFEYVLHADLSKVRMPPPSAGRRADDLWQHTCFEAFFGSAGEAGYHELNFSPSRDWAIYRFSGYRAGMSPVEVTDEPMVTVNRTGDVLQLEASVRLGELGVSQLKLALAAVIEDDQGRLSYWAMRHPIHKPDFHHAESFALELTI